MELFLLLANLLLQPLEHSRYAFARSPQVLDVLLAGTPADILDRLQSLCRARFERL